jgi:Tfp pilus assembly protein PilV
MARSTTKKKQIGMSLIEIVLVVATFFMLTAMFVTTIISGQESSAAAGYRIHALQLADEGLQAVQNLRDQGFASLQVGTYGLSNASGVWQLVATPDASDIYTRTITIASVDASTKSIESRVDWQQATARTGSVKLSTTITDWRSNPPTPPPPPGGGGTGGGGSGGSGGSGGQQAAGLTVDFSYANVVSSAKDITDVWLRNTTSSDMTITSATFVWNKSSAKLNRFQLGSTNVWTSTGPGTPAGIQSSGAALDVVDTIIPANGSLNINSLRYTQAVGSITLTVKIKLSDGSETNESYTFHGGHDDD